jgi:hypothetical protein
MFPHPVSVNKILSVSTVRSRCIIPALPNPRLRRRPRYASAQQSKLAFATSSGLMAPVSDMPASAGAVWFAACSVQFDSQSPSSLQENPPLHGLVLVAC